MITERLDALRAPEAAVSRAAELLRAGGIVAIPTETVYGLAAAADNDTAIQRVFAAKGRPQDNPLIVHISDWEMLSRVAREVPPEAGLCARRFWPGPFTMILPRGDGVAESVSAGLDTVAVRMPSDPIARAVIRAAGPLAAPSANTSGRPSPTTAARVLEDLDGRIDAVVLAGECSVGVESTVLSLAVTPPRLLRPGGVTAEQLRELFPALAVDSAVLAAPKEGERVASPGMKYKHYAPCTPAYLVEGASDAFVRYVNGIGDRVAVCFEEELSHIHGKKLSYGLSSDGAALARRVFEALREVDTMGAAAAYIHAPSKEGIGLAVYNRLVRAAAFQVICL